MTRIPSRFIKDFGEIKRTDTGLRFVAINHKGGKKVYTEKFADEELKRRVWKTLRRRELLTWNFYPLLKDFLAWLVA